MLNSGIESLKLRLIVDAGQLARLTGFLSSPDNLLEESRNNGGVNPPGQFATLMRVVTLEPNRYAREPSHVVTLELVTAFVWRKSCDGEHERRVVPAKYLAKMLTTLEIFPDSGP